MRISIIEALDHFETEQEIKVCYVEVIGEIVDENDEYIYLRKTSWRFKDGGTPRHQIEGIVKSTITNRHDIEVEV